MGERRTAKDAVDEYGLYNTMSLHQRRKNKGEERVRREETIGENMRMNEFVTMRYGVRVVWLIYKKRGRESLMEYKLAIMMVGLWRGSETGGRERAWIGYINIGQRGEWMHGDNNWMSERETEDASSQSEVFL